MIPGDTVNVKKVKDRKSSKGLPRVTLIRANVPQNFKTLSDIKNAA